MIGTFPISKYKMKSTFDHLSTTKTKCQLPYTTMFATAVLVREIVFNAFVTMISLLYQLEALSPQTHSHAKDETTCIQHKFVMIFTTHSSSLTLFLQELDGISPLIVYHVTTPGRNRIKPHTAIYPVHMVACYLVLHTSFAWRPERR